MTFLRGYLSTSETEKYIGPLIFKSIVVVITSFVMGKGGGGWHPRLECLVFRVLLFVLYCGYCRLLGIQEGVSR